VLILISWRLSRRPNSRFNAMPSFAGMFVLCVLFIPLFLFFVNETKAPLYQNILATVAIWGSLFALVMLQHILEGTGVVTSAHHRPRCKVQSDPAWDEMASPLALYGVYAENDESENRDFLPIVADGTENRRDITEEETNQRLLGYYDDHMSHEIQPSGNIYYTSDPLEVFGYDLTGTNTTCLDNTTGSSDFCATSSGTDD